MLKNKNCEVDLNMKSMFQSTKKQSVCHSDLVVLWTLTSCKLFNTWNYRAPETFQSTFNDHHWIYTKNTVNAKVLHTDKKIYFANLSN